ncbi:MAG: hypothetical protein U1F53_21590 [Burkholderiaceae bacterium]
MAGEEALHFGLLREQYLCHLATTTATSRPTTGWGPWPRKTRDDITARMALVSRTLEARGLDATPPMQAAAQGGRPGGGDPRRDPARRDRHRGHRQPLVPLAVRDREGHDPVAFTPSSPPAMVRHA